MNPNALRCFVAAGLLTVPVLAQAQDVASSRPRSALALGMTSHGLRVATVTPESPVFAVDLEHPLNPYVTVFGGFHLGLGLDALGLQAGSRLYVGGQPYQGFFLGLQAEGTRIELNEATRGDRLSLGGLLGYSQTLGEQWRLSLGAGANLSQTRLETVVPPSPECILFTPCLLSPGETHAETREPVVQPIVRIAAAYRF